MNKIVTVTNNVTFKPRQIICLEFSTTCLYAEVIQIIEQRQNCWVRPILIVQESDVVKDLRSSSDLILPTCLFRPCFDTEIIQFLPQLPESNSISSDQPVNFDVNVFVREIWLAHQDKF